MSDLFSQRRGQKGASCKVYQPNRTKRTVVWGVRLVALSRATASALAVLHHIA